MKKNKWITGLLAVMLAAGCSTAGSTSGQGAGEANEPEDEVVETVEVKDLKILTPQQAPALSLLPIILNGQNQIDYAINGAEDLKPAFLNPTPEYDVIIAPTNLGVQLSATGKTGYKLLAVVDWGNLYIVGTDESVLEGDGSNVAWFGQDSVPGLVFAKCYPQLAENGQLFANASEAQATLMAEHAEAALLAEPLATATIAKSEGKYKIIGNVQETWGGDGFPMAALFVNGETYEENKEVYTQMLKEMAEYAETASADQDKLTADIEEAGVETLGLPSSAIVAKCYDQMNVKITNASEAKSAIEDFMAIWNVTDIDAAFAE